jgi:hypothetical protein
MDICIISAPLDVPGTEPCVILDFDALGPDMAKSWIRRNGPALQAAGRPLIVAVGDQVPPDLWIDGVNYVTTYMARPQDGLSKKFWDYDANYALRQHARDEERERRRYP